MHNPETLIIVTLVIGGFCLLYALPMLLAVRARESEDEDEQTEPDEPSNEAA